MWEFWLDTHGADEASRNAIKFAISTQQLAGVTTNPSILAKGKELTGKKIKTLILELLELVPNHLPIAVQVIADTAEEMLVQAKRLHNLSPRIVIKVFTDTEGLRLMPILKEEGIRVLATGILKVKQFEQVIGVAEYAAPYLDAMRKKGISYSKTLDAMIEIKEKQKSSIKIMAASIRDICMITKCSRKGLEAITVPPKTYFTYIYSDDLAKTFKDKFEQDWDNNNCYEDELFAIPDTDEDDNAKAHEKIMQVENVQVGKRFKRLKSAHHSFSSGSPFSPMQSPSPATSPAFNPPPSSPSSSQTTTTTTRTASPLPDAPGYTGGPGYN